MGFALKHWIAMLIFLALGYFLGMKFPHMIPMPGMKAAG